MRLGDSLAGIHLVGIHPEGIHRAGMTLVDSHHRVEADFYLNDE